MTSVSAVTATRTTRSVGHGRSAHSTGRRTMRRPARAGHDGRRSATGSSARAPSRARRRLSTRSSSARARRPARRRGRRRSPPCGVAGRVSFGRVTHGARNDASRERRFGRHRTASRRPVTLNATWVAIDIPSRPVTSRQAPATSPKANRPGYSTGRKWISGEPRRGGEPGEDVVEAGGERALQQAAVDELLDDRRADADHQHEQHHRRRRSPGRPASRRSPTAGRRRTCPARCRGSGR